MNKAIGFFIAYITASVLLLASCSTAPAQTSPNITEMSPEPAASSTLSSPKISAEPSFTVKTDYSGLTPYQPPEDRYTRLSEDALPALVPSSDYGPLLPYVGDRLVGTFMGDVNIYGLVTTDGMIVTDAVYVNVYTATGKSGSSSSKTVYMLTQIADDTTIPDTKKAVNAVCALDGSWTTAFDYVSVLPCDEVILLIQDFESNDIDVIDYDGHLLYSFSELDCFNRLSPGTDYQTIMGDGEGYLLVRLKNGTTAFIAERTGDTVYTDYSSATGFYEGYSCVCVGDLWGYIDSSFRIVIDPQYLSAGRFEGGRAQVQLDGDTFAVIDTDGSVLFSVDGKFISGWDNKLYETSYGTETEFYDSNFQPITLKSSASNFFYLGEGWYSFKSVSGVVLCHNRDEYVYSDADSIVAVDGEYVVYRTLGDGWKMCVAEIGGKLLFPPFSPGEVTFLDVDGSIGPLILINSFFPNHYTVYNIEGKVLLSGSGKAAYRDDLRLFSVDNTQYFALADLSGKELFRLSLLKSTPD